MKVLIFSDIHGDLRALERIASQQATCIFLLGLSNFGKAWNAGRNTKTAGQRSGHCGNHETQSENHSFCQHYGFLDFHARCARLNPHLASRNGPAWLQQYHAVRYAREYSEEEIARPRCIRGMKSLHLVVHFPAQYQARRIRARKHGGSSTLREW